MSDEFSKGTLAVLLIMTLVISVLSTISMLTALNEATQIRTVEKAPTEELSKGTIMLAISGTEEPVSESASIKLAIKKQ